MKIVRENMKINLLSPAGGMKELQAAVIAGADEVYVGGSRYSARSSAKNFTDEELVEAVRFCHLHDVKLFVAVNTLITDEELEGAVRYCAMLARIGVDAIILQDLGLFYLLKKLGIKIPFHASTQMTFHNLEGVQFAERIGFERVVLPREMSIEEIKYIRKHTTVELEVFCHGALCVSYSGQCLFSSYIGGRSANRGECAQPCRKSYRLVGEKEGRRIALQRGERGSELGDGVGDSFQHNSIDSVSIDTEGDFKKLISPYDLNVSERLEAFREIDDVSLKIEGRMKNYDYVFTTVSAYRGAIDEIAFDDVTTFDNNAMKSSYQAGAVSRDHSSFYQSTFLSTFNEDSLLEYSYNRGYTKGYLFDTELADYRGTELTGHRGRYLGRAVRWRNGRLTIRLEDSLSSGDEVQYKLQKRTVGARADTIYLENNDHVFESNRSGRLRQKQGNTRQKSGRFDKKGRHPATNLKENKERFSTDVQRVSRAEKGQVVTIAFKHKVPHNAPLYKTYDTRFVQAIDDYLHEHEHPKRWSLELDIRIVAENPVSLRGVFTDCKTGVKQFNTTVTGAVPEVSQNRPLTEETVRKQLSKFGNTSLLLKHLDISLSEGLYLSVKTLNELRRELVNEFEKQILDRVRLETIRSASEKCLDDQAMIQQGKKEAHSMTNEDAVCSIHENFANGLDACSSKTLSKIVEGVRKEAIAEVERLGKRDVDYDFFTKNINPLKQIVNSYQWSDYVAKYRQDDYVWVSHVSQIGAFRDIDLSHRVEKRDGNEDDITTAYDHHTCMRKKPLLIADYTLNCTNAFSFLFLLQQGADYVVLSSEVNPMPLLDRLGGLKARAGIFVQGELTLMNMKFCPVGAELYGRTKCGACSMYDAIYMQDTYGEMYRLDLDDSDCTCRIMGGIRNSSYRGIDGVFYRETPVSGKTKQSPVVGE